MILKAVSLFLIFMLVLGMFGKLRMPGMIRRHKDKKLTARKCPRCGAIETPFAKCSCPKPKDGA